MTVVRERERVGILYSPEFPIQLDLVAEFADALVGAGQEDAVPYLTLALLSTYTLQIKKRRMGRAGHLSRLRSNPRS